MSDMKKVNRQITRSKRMLEQALLEILNNKPFSTITISEITKSADLARSTFYAHFETKEDLLNSLINGVLDKFFNLIENRDLGSEDVLRDIEINIEFFRIWGNHKDIIQALESVDFDCLLVPRLRDFWIKSTRKSFEYSSDSFSEIHNGYMLNFLSYSCAGFLKEWIHNDFEQSPELMGELLYHMTGPPVLFNSRDKFQDRFSDFNKIS